jgi:hypothetical protein
MTSTTSRISLPFELGDAQCFRGLGLVPLFPAQDPTLEYVGLDEAAALGLAFTEIDEAGAVGTLVVSNPSPGNVLLFEGEELVGAKQNRVLERTILVHANAKVPVPVNCVERGRWSYRSEQFSPAPRAAHPELRRQSFVGGQGAVWSEIADKAARLDAESPTEAAEEMYVRRGGSIEEYLAALPRRDEQCGAIVAIAGRVVCLDYVSRSDVYAGLYSKLLRGYALDAIERPTEAPVPEDYIQLLLKRVAHARRDATPPVGLGVRHSLHGPGISGSTLVHGDEIVAMSVFPAVRA